MWSQTKKKLENFTCDSLKDRVKFFSSNYRMHDGIGRTYIAVDGAEVYNMCTLKRDYYRHPKPGCYSQVEKPIEAFMQKKDPESQHSCGLPGFIGARDGT
ncbi:SF0329 family protein [Caproiciproducens sp. R1]|uniref:SF0329 family protein n=1 Tax=Caproiciproducens sp. R1 TaxID=3435000 RepID=UPI004033483A